MSQPMRLWRRSLAWASMTMVAAAAGTCLPARLAAAAPDPPPIITPPAPGVAPGTAVRPGAVVDMFYTATDGKVWVVQGMGPIGSGSCGPPVPYGGRLVSAPAPIWTGSTEIVFGEGTDHQLWYNQLGSRFGTPWHPLGGRLTSGPGAVWLGGDSYAVFARGTDGAVWQRVHTSAGWQPWQSAGGRVLAGTAPTAAYLTGTGRIYVGVVGTNRQVYLKVANGGTVFFSIGGQVTATPALTAITPVTLVAFGRGTDNAGYYNRYTVAGGAAGWRSIGRGALTSGLAAGSATVAGRPMSYTFALVPAGVVYENVGSWATYPPRFTGWGC